MNTNGTADLNTLMSHLGTWIHIFGFGAIGIAGLAFYLFHTLKHKFSPAAQAGALLGILMAGLVVWYLPAMLSVTRNSGDEITGINSGTYGMHVTAPERHQLPGVGGRA
ncbi:signal peptidase complex subunit 2 [Aldersonia sp. NBC_00410]|uniref:hypothetical protein n=1 Tax=Aldersonia sp. NBC_00410 TaxID=2975954 RepID=UPI00224D2F73|nr:hypothetical protein [Aldersonia sp. NBC_00410]MCX5046260.1 signal peptidase complex subunit 2 [Aldersonia sp. NBC_00410]